MVIETDPSNLATKAILYQGENSSFFSRTLSKSELNRLVVGENAYSIIEANPRWRHYLTSKPFTLIADQKSVIYMFDN